ncbi:MAG: riboflavin kinase [Patescibacteria group bacterium]|nr:riboflavin kinase [Patescibacteria group bacterium]
MNLPLSISGTVRKNLGRGTDLGYPTLNIPYDGEAVDGVYFGRVTVPGKNYQNLPSAIFVGSAVTFGETTRWVEAFLLDFSGDLSGLPIIVTLEKYSRENRKFDSAEALVAQMKRDEELARAYFSLPDKNSLREK